MFLLVSECERHEEPQDQYHRPTSADAGEYGRIVAKRPLLWGSVGLPSHGRSDPCEVAHRARRA